jgi:hypothetical protein
MAANATGIANTPIRLTSAELGVEDDLTQGSEQRREEEGPFSVGFLMVRTPALAGSARFGGVG